MGFDRAYEDPTINDIVERLPTDVRTSLSTHQRTAIAEALKESRRPHRVDFRISIPLGFTQLYVVLQMGKDLRKKTQDALIERRVRAGQTAVGSMIGVAALLLIASGLGVAYVAKSRAGIDLMPNAHAKDIAQSLGIR